MKHKIGWLNFPGYKGETWNPITGCSAISEGCKNCYAERISKRFKWPWGRPVQHPERFHQLSHWKKPRAVFVCSMSDMFYPGIDTNFLLDMNWIMRLNPWHIFLILTKRAGQMKAFYSNVKCPDNVWLGVTAENQQTADERIPILLQTPCAHRFVSVEPMLEAVDLSGHGSCHCPDALGLIDWVICGGESGKGVARPMKWQWPTLLLNQCFHAGVPFFMKQMSEYGGADKHDIPPLLNIKQFPEVSK